MSKRNKKLVDWKVTSPDKVTLYYSEGENLVVSKTDFDRAFGAIVSADYDAVKRDFAI